MEMVEMTLEERKEFKTFREAQSREIGRASCRERV